MRFKIGFIISFVLVLCLIQGTYLSTAMFALGFLLLFISWYYRQWELKIRDSGFQVWILQGRGKFNRSKTRPGIFVWFAGKDGGVEHDKTLEQMFELVENNSKWYANNIMYY